MKTGSRVHRGRRRIFDITGSKYRGKTRGKIRCKSNRRKVRCCRALQRWPGDDVPRQKFLNAHRSTGLYGPLKATERVSRARGSRRYSTGAKCFSVLGGSFFRNCHQIDEPCSRYFQPYIRYLNENMETPGDLYALRTVKSTTFRGGSNFSSHVRTYMHMHVVTRSMDLFFFSFFFVL